MSAIAINRLMGSNRRSGGFALLMVLMLIATSSVVGISYIYSAQIKTAGTGNLMLASQARYLAESGLQHGLYSLQTEATPFGSAASPNGTYHVEDDDGGYVFYITETSTPTYYQIVATGTEGAISQTISMTVRLTSDYSAKMVEHNPRHWWRLGDSGLTAVDSHSGPNTNDGTYVNAVTRGVDGALLGDADTAAEFRGSNDYVNLGNMRKVDYNRVTFGCWVRADTWATSFPRIMSRSTGADWSERRWEIALDSSRKIRFTVRLKDYVYELYGSTALQRDEWYFIVATYDKGARQMKVYLDGELDGTKSGTVKEDIKGDNNIDAWIGDCPTWSNQRPWDGPIDEVFIMKDRAMTADQIAELYELRIPNVEVISWDD
jgi:hypothetical protein